MSTLFGAVSTLPQTALSMINSHTKSRTVGDTVANASGVQAASGSTTATSTAAQATTDIGTTFLSLLTKELQNQDPTAPMDSTAMVGQMISLNELDQLIAIHSALTPTTSTTTGTTGTTGSVSHAVAPTDTSTDSASTLAKNQALLASIVPSASSSVAQLGTDSTLSAAAQSASSAATLNLSNLNSMFGGK